VTIGRDAGGSLLVVVHTVTDAGDATVVRLISARAPTRREREVYESGASD
jgi:uncharacterized DUF497 family protein